MIGNELYSLNAMHFGSGVYESVSKMSPGVRLKSFWGTCHHKACSLKSRMVPGSGLWRRIYFQQSGCYFHHCKHMAFDITDLGECDRVNLTGLSIFQLLSFMLARLYCRTFHIHG